MPDEDDHGAHVPHHGDTDVAALLRQLSQGLASYRLYPDDMDQPTFVAAVHRIGVAAERALRRGPVAVQIHGEQLLGVDGVDHETAARLAASLFARRAEELEIRAVPDRDDLATLYRTLTRPPDEVAAAGGVGWALWRAGVTSIVVRGAEPDPAEGDGVLTPAQKALWNRLRDPAGFAASLLVGGITGRPADDAEALYLRFRAIIDNLPPWLAEAPDPYIRLQDVVRQLPAGVRRAFAGLLMGRVATDRLAQGFLGTMTSAEVARVLAELGEDGADPVDLAYRLVECDVHEAEVVDLVVAAQTGAEDAGTLVSAAVGDAADPVAQTVSDLLARGAAAQVDADLQALRDGFPASTEDHRALALDAVRDYLKVERDRDRLDLVLGSWSVTVGDEIRRGDVRAVEQLVAVAADVRRTNPHLAAVVEQHRGQVLDDHLVADLVARARDRGPHAVAPLVEPLGAAGIRRLFDVLAEEPDQGTRGQLVALLAAVASDNGAGGPARIEAVEERLNDDRWYVARNAVTVLARLGGSGIVPSIVKVADHPEAAVRREVVRALGVAGGDTAVSQLRRLAVDPVPEVRAAAIHALAGQPGSAAAAALGHVVRSGRDLTDRQRALVELSRHHGDAGRATLRSLAARSGGLPRRLRRRAAALLKQRRPRRGGR
ncbi:MAG: HEAT repeat domain-containing protein [Actinobacteria bacterium]|nr:HEAT repeat domain-containing protein [Actinomycetota bacterium]